MPSPAQWMNQAVRLAERGRPLAYPNPLVGAMIVKNGKAVSSGSHRCYGHPHGEAEALSKARGDLRGATLFVTLEPCSTFGKTPPCVDGIIKRKIAKVIIGALDPNPIHRGGGLKVLRRAGIHVEVGLLAEEIEEQNEVFFTWIKKRRPFVALKLAETLDGKIATHRGESRWITGQEARARVHELRGQYQAVLVGRHTALLDNPRLTARPNRRGAKKFQPVRVVIDRRLSLPHRLRLFRQDPGRTLLVTSIASYQKKIRTLSQRTIGVLGIQEKKGKLDLKELLLKLSEMEVISILVEGGGETAWNFIQEGLVDRVYLFIAPKIMGGRNSVPAVGGRGFDRLEKMLRLRDVRVTPVGEDWLFEGRIRNT